MKKPGNHLDDIALIPTAVSAFVYILDTGEVVIAMAGPEGPIVKAATVEEAKQKFDKIADLHFAVKKTQFVDSLIKNTDRIAYSPKYQSKIAVEYVNAVNE